MTQSLLGLLMALLSGEAPYSTVRLAASEKGDYPRSIQGERTLSVSLAAVGAGRNIVRAWLHLGRDRREAWLHRDEPADVRVAGDPRPLPLMPPRYLSFDVTRPIQAAAATGVKVIRFEIHSFPGYRPLENCLDVTLSGLVRKRIPSVTGLGATHRDGLTLLEWRECEPAKESLTLGEWKELSSRDDGVGGIRYRIYRSSEPITAASMARCQFVDEIGPLSAWNSDLRGIAAAEEDALERYVTREGSGPVTPGTAIYAHHPTTPEPAYYTVRVAADGAEDWTNFPAGSFTTIPLEEQVGLGPALLQKVERPAEFQFEKNATLYSFVRWEHPPLCPYPSTPRNYLVAVPEPLPKPASASLELHSWGGSQQGGYGWWFNAQRGALLIAANQVPYDWWTGYHEHWSDARGWRTGSVRDYTQDRLLAFLDFAATRWSIDRHKVLIGGVSMGGTGSTSLALRRPERFAIAQSWVGVHQPHASPGFRESFEEVWGRMDWSVPSADRGVPAFTWFDNAWYVRRNPAADCPLLCFANGKNDAGIGWGQAVEFWRALQEARQPHVFLWGQEEHRQRGLFPGPALDQRTCSLDLRNDRSLPAFCRCDLDENPGNGAPTDGARTGQSNLYLYWDDRPDRSIDAPGHWRMLLRLNAAAPRPSCHVDVTPRRCQQFRALPGESFDWTARDTTGAIRQSGQVHADRFGRVTVPRVAVTQKGTSLDIIRTGSKDGGRVP